MPEPRATLDPDGGALTSASEAWFPQWFAWMVPLFGGDAAVRQWHHLATWFFIVFTMVHVYLVFHHDYVEGHGVLSSMAGGWKFLPRRSNGGSPDSGAKAARPAQDAGSTRPMPARARDADAKATATVKEDRRPGS